MTNEEMEQTKNAEETSNETVKEVAQGPKEEVTLESKEKQSKPHNAKKNKILIWITIILVVILIGLVGFLVNKKYPQIYKDLRGNKYGIDYNINKVRSYDWDTVLTDMKVARALDVPQKSISSAKNPDWAWVLNEPETFVKEVVCGSLLEEKILNEDDSTAKSLINVSVMICSNSGKADELFKAREDEVTNITKQDSTIVLKTMEDNKGVGSDSYYYLLERTNAPASEGATPTTDIFSGLIFKRGPFMVKLEESENKDGTGSSAVISTEKFRSTVAKMIDREIKRSLSSI